MSTVSLTELRRNLESYLDQAQLGDVIITKYGKEVARLVATSDAATAGSAGHTSSSATSGADEPSAAAANEA